MSVDVDAVNERLNGLVTLLKAVGVDDSKGGDKHSSAMDMARQLNDEQIEAIINKLQQAQTEAPQIIAALEAHAEAQSLTGGSSSKHRKEEPQEEVVEEVVEENTEIEDDDDDFDEDANYPMVGHGVSDDISVVSDLTTPTVVPNSQVPEEEHYRETLPPMIVGGVGEPSMVISAPKRKNLVSQVRAPPVGVIGASRGRNIAAGGPPMHIGPPVTAATAGGAAAARRKMYQDTMAKLQENPNGLAYVGPSSAPSKSMKAGMMTTPSSKPSGGINKFGSDSPVKSKKKVSGRKNTSNSMNDWSSFDEPPKHKSSSSSSKGTGQTVIDDDGFLVGDTNFDPFAASTNPFKSSAGDLEFGETANKFMLSDSSAPGGFASFDSTGPISSFSGGSPSGKKSKIKSRRSGTSGDHHGHGHGESLRSKQRASATSGSGAPGAGRRRGRRMSVN